MIKEINFITIGDKNFFHIIHFSLKQLMKFYPECKFYIYDWGFTQSQKNKTLSYPISILIDCTLNECPQTVTHHYYTIKSN